MSIALICPTCCQKSYVPDGVAGKIIQCPYCQVTFTTPPGILNEIANSRTAQQAAPNRFIQFCCPTCANGVKAPWDAAGRKVYCTHCGQKLQVPSVPHDTTTSFQTVSPREQTRPMPPLADNPLVRGVESVKSFYSQLRQPHTLPLTRLGSIFRIVNPSLMFLALIMLPLPFLELRCNNPTQSGQLGITLLTQSGLQSLYGGYSLTNTGKNLALNSADLNNQIDDSDQYEPYPAFIMWGVLCALIGGGIVGAITPLGKKRCLLIGSGSGTILIFLLLQLVIGFPMAHSLDMAKDKIVADARQKARQQVRQRPKGFRIQPFSGRSEEQAAAQAGAQAVLYVSAFQMHYTTWFWLWIVVLILSTAGVVGECTCVFWYRSLMFEFQKPSNQVSQP